MEGVENLCEQLKSTDLENKERCIELSSVHDIVSKGKNYLLVKLLSNKITTGRPSKQQ